MTATLIGPPCLRCGLVTFANPCRLAYGLEETAILGWRRAWIKSNHKLRGTCG